MSYPDISPPRSLLPWPTLARTWWCSGCRSDPRLFASRIWVPSGPYAHQDSCRRFPLPICSQHSRMNRGCRPACTVSFWPTLQTLKAIRTLKQSMITWVSSYESARNRSNSSCPAVSQSDSSMCTLSTKRSWVKHVSKRKREFHGVKSRVLITMHIILY